MTPRRPQRWWEAPRARRVYRFLVPWLLLVAIGGLVALGLDRYIDSERAGAKVHWRREHAFALLAGAGIVAVIAFVLNRRRVATLGFSQTGFVGARGAFAWLSDLPAVLRVLALGCLAIALVRARDRADRPSRRGLGRHHDRVRHVEVDGGDRPRRATAWMRHSA